MKVVWIIYIIIADHVAKICLEIKNLKSGKNDYPGISLKVKIEPLHITLHQKVLEFLKEYAANCQEDLFEDKTAEEINPFENYEEENLLNEIKEPLEESKKEVSQTVTQSHSDIFIERISVSRFYVQFNYRSYKLSMTKLYNIYLFSQC